LRASASCRRTRAVVSYNAPDADVLLDDDFAATHCFRVQSADKEHPEQIGLAFSPARGRDRLVDVTGVIWIDRVTPKLRTLEFRYTGLEPAATESGSGGHIEFRTMQNGVAFIERWHLRLASLVADPRRRSPPSGVPNDRTKRTDFAPGRLAGVGGHRSRRDVARRRRLARHRRRACRKRRAASLVPRHSRGNNHVGWDEH
jgi:hypothetical protein